MRMKLYVYVAAVLTLLATLCASSPYAGGELEKRAAGGHGHAHTTGPPGYGSTYINALDQCPVNQMQLKTEYSNVVSEFQLRGMDGMLCQPMGLTPGEGGSHSHSHGGHAHSTTTAPSTTSQWENETVCFRTWHLAMHLVIDLNLTTPCCLGYTGDCLNATAPPPKSYRTPLKQAYGYGFIMLCFETALAFLGLLILPVARHPKFKAYYDYMLAFLVAMGVSALMCDALLHLIPGAYGLHHHGATSGHAHMGAISQVTVVWLSSIVAITIYIFFVFEYLLASYTPGGGHSHGFSADMDELESTMKDGVKKEEQEMVEKSVEVSELQNPTITFVKDDEKDEDDNAGCGTKVCRYLLNVKPLAWIILMGDSVHNFADGLALGAAVSQSLSLGFSTLIALVLHEIPHELGDFYILLSTGMSWYVATLFNFISAVIAFGGFFIGVGVGTISEEANGWILVVAAGVFFYVALVDLMPTLIEPRQKGKARVMNFVVINCGFFIPFTVLLLISLYEGELNARITV